jgi:hypothetical protein
MNDDRRLRLTREAIGDRDGTMPGAEGFLRAIGIVALVLFVVVFTGSYPN